MTRARWWREKQERLWARLAFAVLHPRDPKTGKFVKRTA